MVKYLDAVYVAVSEWESLEEESLTSRHLSEPSLF